jgi:hypothetical protein
MPIHLYSLKGPVQAMHSLLFRYLIGVNNGIDSNFLKECISVYSRNQNNYPLLKNIYCYMTQLSFSK